MGKIEQIKLANRSLEILRSIGLTDKHLNGKHQACPACGGKDRFQWNKKKGLFVCRHYDYKYHDFISLVAHIKFCDNIKDAIDYCMDYLGLNKINEYERDLLRIRQEAAMIKAKQTEDAELVMGAKKKLDAKLKAKAKWAKAQPVISHPYLSAKRVSGEFIRQSEGALLIPIYNSNRELVNLQHIYANGGKFFMVDAEIVGCFSVLGSLKRASKAFICEGFATGMSLYQQYRHPVVVAFMAGNLKKVGLAIRQLYPSLEIIICADNDIHVDDSIINAGVHYSRESASLIGAKVLIPFLDGKIDFNDLANKDGGELIYSTQGSEIRVTRLALNRLAA
ncbi:MAG: toprim domain-containing protein [Candidatus Moraniibacteriota bacterium]|nr:MAG: toprim domain-containing protein [Candidatus Moranbacteria bacterium]